MFFKGSRYEEVPTQFHTLADGRVVAHKGVRFIPPAGHSFGHVVDEGERADHIAFEHHRDPEVFWRICDANLVAKVEDLTAEPGTVIDIPRPGA